jgi:hypothetical protein
MQHNKSARHEQDVIIKYLLKLDLAELSILRPVTNKIAD